MRLVQGVLVDLFFLDCLLKKIKPMFEARKGRILNLGMEMSTYQRTPERDRLYKIGSYLLVGRNPMWGKLQTNYHNISPP